MPEGTPVIVRSVRGAQLLVEDIDGTSVGSPESRR